MSKNRSFSGSISQRYALALFELSNELNKTDEYVSRLSLFMKIYKTLDLKSPMPFITEDLVQILFPDGL